MTQIATYKQVDENGIVALEANWDIEYTRSRDIPGDWNSPPEPGEITIVAKTLEEVFHYYDDMGYELKVTSENGATWERIERHLGQWLCDEELIECCEQHWESLDEEAKSAA
jgi:hypothetical protein